MKRSREEEESTEEQKRQRSIFLPSPPTPKLIYFKVRNPDGSESPAVPNPKLNEDFEVTPSEFCIAFTFVLQTFFSKIHSESCLAGEPLPDFDLLTLLSSLFYVTDMEFSCAVVTIIYILRAYSRHRKQKSSEPFLTEENWRSITIASSLLASKLFDDLSMSNKDFAEIFEKESLTVSLLNSFELTMLRLLNFDLWISDSEYQNISEILTFELGLIQMTSARPKSAASTAKDLTTTEPPIDQPVVTATESLPESPKPKDPHASKDAATTPAPLLQNPEPQAAAASTSSSAGEVVRKGWWDVSSTLSSPLSWVWHTALKE
jgi:hypothetical protein